MNNRIEEIYQQSFIEIKDEIFNPCFTFSKIRFAELILQEVDKVVDNLYHVLPLEQAAVLLTFDEQLKDHFYGVEGE